MRAICAWRLLEEFDAEQRREPRELRAPLRRLRGQHGRDEGGLHRDRGVLHLRDERRRWPPVVPGSGDCAVRRAAANVRRSGARPRASSPPAPCLGASARRAGVGAGVAIAASTQSRSRQSTASGGAMAMQREVSPAAAPRRCIPRLAALRSRASRRRLAACAASLRRSSLTSVRNLSGEMRASSACTRSSSGGCVANHEAPNLLSPAWSGCWRRTCARHRRRVRVRAACPRRSPPSRRRRPAAPADCA